MLADLPFTHEGGGVMVAILRIMARTRFLSSSERVVEYFLMSAIGAVRFDHFPDVNLWFLFGHGIFPLTRAYLTSNPQIGARDISTIVPHQNIPAVRGAPAASGYTIPPAKTPLAKTAQAKMPHPLACT